MFKSLVFLASLAFIAPASAYELSPQQQIAITAAAAAALAQSVCPGVTVNKDRTADLLIDSGLYQGHLDDDDILMLLATAYSQLANMNGMIAETHCSVVENAENPASRLLDVR
jgi:hypothetical protein